MGQSDRFVYQTSDKPEILELYLLSSNNMYSSRHGKWIDVVQSTQNGIKPLYLKHIQVFRTLLRSGTHLVICILAH